MLMKPDEAMGPSLWSGHLHVMTGTLDTDTLYVSEKAVMMKPMVVLQDALPNFLDEIYLPKFSISQKKRLMTDEDRLDHSHEANITLSEDDQKQTVCFLPHQSSAPHSAMPNRHRVSYRMFQHTALS